MHNPFYQPALTTPVVQSQEAARLRALLEKGEKDFSFFQELPGEELDRLIGFLETDAEEKRRAISRRRDEILHLEAVMNQRTTTRQQLLEDPTVRLKIGPRQPIEELELPFHHYVRLRRHGLRTVQQLCALSPRILMKKYRMPPQGVTEIGKQLAKLGLSLQKDEPELPEVPFTVYDLQEVLRRRQKNSTGA